MSDLVRFLGPLKDDLLFIQEDGKAKEFAVFLGLADRFHKQRPAGIRTPGWIHAESFMEHPTHWVFVIRYRDFPQEADNGWSVMFVPKSAGPIEEAEAALREQMNRRGGGQT